MSETAMASDRDSPQEPRTSDAETPQELLDRVDLFGVDPDFGVDPEVLRNTYRFYKAASAIGPIVQEPHHGVYLATRYADILDIERRHDDFSACVTTLGPFAVGKVPQRPDEAVCPFGKADLAEELSTWKKTTPLNIDSILALDPPDHTDIRNVINRLFTPGRKEALTPRLEMMARELIDAFVGDGEAEWIAQYAAPYTYLTMTEVMDFPRADEATLRKRFADLANPERAPLRRNMVDGSRPRGRTDDPDNPLSIPQERMHAYIAERRASPGDDTLSQVATARRADGTLPEIDELVGVANTMYGAGQITTKDLIGNAMRYLALHGELQDRLREHPEEIEGFIAEMLRFDPPNQGLFRFCIRDTEVGGVPLPAGAVIWMIWAQGNRDPEVFDDPETFNHLRENAFQAMSFGHGRHFCPGQPLARLEAKLTFEEVLRRMKNIRLKKDSELTYDDWFVERGPTKMHIEFDPV
jgi:cytochrome P450